MVTWISGRFFYGIFYLETELKLVDVLKTVIEPADWERSRLDYAEEKWYNRNRFMGLEQLNTSWGDDLYLDFGGDMNWERDFYCLAIKSTFHFIETYDTGDDLFLLPEMDTKVWDAQIQETSQILHTGFNPPQFFLGFDEEGGVHLFYGMEIQENTRWNPPEELPPHVTTSVYAPHYNPKYKIIVTQPMRGRDTFYVIIPETYLYDECSSEGPVKLTCPSTPRWDKLIQEKCEKHNLPWKDPTFRLVVTQS